MKNPFSKSETHNKTAKKASIQPETIKDESDIRVQSENASAQQLDLGIKEPFINQYYNRFQKFQLWLSRFETRKFVREFHTWFLSSLSLGMLLVQYRLLSPLYDEIPSRIPIFQYFLDVESRIVQKEYLYSIPVITFLIILSGFLTAYNTYSKNKDIGNLTLFTVLVSTILMTLALANILSNYSG